MSAFHRFSTLDSHFWSGPPIVSGELDEVTLRSRLVKDAGLVAGSTTEGIEHLQLSSTPTSDTLKSPATASRMTRPHACAGNEERRRPTKRRPDRRCILRINLAPWFEPALQIGPA